MASRWVRPSFVPRAGQGEGCSDPTGGAEITQGRPRRGAGAERGDQGALQQALRGVIDCEAVVEANNAESSLSQSSSFCEVRSVAARNWQSSLTRLKIGLVLRKIIRLPATGIPIAC